MVSFVPGATAYRVGAVGDSTHDDDPTLYDHARIDCQTPIWNPAMLAATQIKVASFAATLAVALAMVASLTIPGLNWVPAATVLMIGGLNQPTLSDEEMASLLNGRYAGDTLVSAKYPAQAWPLTGLTSLTVGQSVDVGIENLEAAIRETNPAVVVGISEGSLVLDAVQRRLAAAPDAPGPDQIEFVAVADMNRGNGLFTLFRGLFIPIVNYAPQPEPVTPYHTIVVVKEFDGWADFPDRPWNLLATLNAIAGSGVIPGFPSEHNATNLADLSKVPESNITTTTNSMGGTTTTYLVPTPDLPLLQPLRNLGLPTGFVGAINNILKPVVDAGYSRNDRQTAQPSSDPAGSSQPSDTTAEPSTDVVRQSAVVTSKSVGADRSSAGSDPATPDVTPRPDRTGHASEDTDAFDADAVHQTQTRAENRASNTRDKRPPKKTRAGCTGGGKCTIPVHKSGAPTQRAAGSDSVPGDDAAMGGT